MNSVSLTGNVGKDPELQYLSDGRPMCYFTLATDEGYTKNGERVEKTAWHNIKVFGKLAEVIAKYVKKGDRNMSVVGKIAYSNWTDSDGSKRTSTEIQMSGFDFGVRSKNNQEGGEQEPQQEPQQEDWEEGETDDDMPF